MDDRAWGTLPWRRTKAAPPRPRLDRRLQQYPVRNPRACDPMSSVVVQYPPIPQLSSADEIQVRRALRRNRPLATGLLAFMIVIAAATHLTPLQGWLVQL